MLINKKRSPLKEIMDDPQCDELKLINTVKQFKYINILFSGSRRLIKRYFLKDLKPGTDKPYRFLDIGAGGCDIALWVKKWCSQRNISIEIVCMENDKRIIPFAEKMIEGVSCIELIPESAFSLKNHGTFDFSFSNHFLHHLPNEAIKELIAVISEHSESFLMNDLERNLLSFISYKIFATLFLHKSFANYDGGLSILRGFKMRELRSICDKINDLPKINIMKAFPGRIFILKKGRME